jgi:hypothetical protein
VLRLALLAWGLGHLRLGERRGWLLFGLEVAWLAALALSLSLLPTDRWLLSYALLAGFIVGWVWQAISAYRGARLRSGRSTGAAWLLAAAPAVICVLTGFWLVAGATASPAATFQHYVGAWRAGDAAAALALFDGPRDAAALAAEWDGQRAAIAARISELARADPQWRLDRDDPGSNLRFDLHAGDAAAAEDRVRFDIHVVRQVAVATTFLGLVPASRSETRVVETIGQAALVRRSAAGSLGAAGASVWLIESLVIGGVPS